MKIESFVTWIVVFYRQNDKWANFTKFIDRPMNFLILYFMTWNFLWEIDCKNSCFTFIWCWERRKSEKKNRMKSFCVECWVSKLEFNFLHVTNCYNRFCCDESNFTQLFFLFYCKNKSLSWGIYFSNQHHTFYI